MLLMTLRLLPILSCQIYEIKPNDMFSFIKNRNRTYCLDSSSSPSSSSKCATCPLRTKDNSTVTKRTLPNGLRRNFRKCRKGYCKTEFYFCSFIVFRIKQQQDNLRLRDREGGKETLLIYDIKFFKLN